MPPLFHALFAAHCIETGILRHNIGIDYVTEGGARMRLQNKPVPAEDADTKMREKWMQEIWQLKQQLDDNEQLFNMTDDFDITAYTIHERTALEFRYRYLIRLIRAHDEARAQKVNVPAMTM